MLKRSAFARQRPERVRTYPSPIPEHLRRSARMDADIGIAVSAIPKDAAVRSEAYRRLVALMDCIHCGKASRSQHAHENEHKGKGLKLDDRRAMPLCCDEPGAEGCHTRFDQYRLLPGGRDAHVEQGRVWSAQTRAAISLGGLWPPNLPTFSERSNHEEQNP